jgi:outer membrane biosynthesis protein TonB
MRRLLLVLTLVAVALAVSAQTKMVGSEPPFRPAEARAVTDLTIPITSIASGTVVLNALVSETGTVQRVEVRRGIPSLTEPAASAVAGWTFSPATFRDKPVASRVPVAVTVRPPVAFATSLPLPPLEPRTERDIQAAFQPPLVLRASFPNGAPMSIGGDVTVVLEGSVGTAGEVQDLKVLRDVPAATSFASAAIESWRFQSAAWEGQPVKSTIILVFVFRPAIFYP